MRLLIDIPTKKVMDGEEISVSGILYLESNLVGTSIYFAFPDRISVLPNCGDLVDRDELVKETKRLGTVTCHQPYGFPYDCNLAEWCKAAPVVIPAERSEE